MALDPKKKAKADARLYRIRSKRHKNDYVKYDEDGSLYMELDKEARNELINIAVNYIFEKDCKTKKKVVK